jgi:Domain of unknown function (DUF4145)
MPSKIVQRCGHCGNTTAFTIAAAGSQPSLITAQEKETTTWTTWRVLLCSTCAQPTLERDVQETKGAIGSAPPARSETPEVLYPVERSTRWQHIPPAVQEMYTEALKVEKVSPRSCAVMAGLALEAICTVEQAKGTSLAERLNNLAQSERIPHTLVGMAQHLRYFRNISAHAMEEKVTEADVPILLYFVEAILEYLYVAPATIQAVQARLHVNKKKVES